MEGAIRAYRPTEGFPLEIGGALIGGEPPLGSEDTQSEGEN